MQKLLSYRTTKYQDAKLIRINPREAELDGGVGFSISTGGLEGLELILQNIENIRIKEIIEKAIKRAYAMGDKDEMFIKYVGHTLAAIYVGNGYKNVVDYHSPGYSYDQFTKEEVRQELHYQQMLWKEVEDVCKIIGKEEFRRIAKICENTSYFSDFYIEQAMEQ